MKKLKALVEAGHTLACSAVSVAELFAGMRPRERAGLLRREWTARGRTLSLPDLLIAATAIHHGMILVTDNVKDFPMTELQRHVLEVDALFYRRVAPADRKALEVRTVRPTKAETEKIRKARAESGTPIPWGTVRCRAGL